MSESTNQKPKSSPLRKRYIARLVGRCIILVISLLLLLLSEEQFYVMRGWNFFHKLSIFHILWLIWVIDMLLQLIPVKNHIPLGSQKHLKHHFREVKDRINKESLKKYISNTTKAAYKVMLLWLALVAAIAVLFYTGAIERQHLLIISVVFYVCDLICVLIWCPFRLIMGNKCCTTCRIFNWDHFMMFSPIVFAGGFFAVSLFALSLVVFAVWEICVFLYPERFWEGSNVSLKCSECTDKLCTQYCQKLRKKNSAKEAVFPDKDNTDL